MDKPNIKMVETACGRLGMDGRTALRCYRPAASLADAGFFSTPGRGGGRLLVSSRGETLWASSALSPSAHEEAFREGLRN